MKSKKLVLVIVISVFMAVSTFTLATANGFEPPILPPPPSKECGSYTHSNIEPGTYGDYSVYWVVEPETVIITSTNGWEISRARWLIGSDIIADHIFPPGTTSVIIPLPEFGAEFLAVTLERECACRPTGRFVYTLFGNYPCNLIAEDNSIPARFLNPAYTGPLCNLPTVDHIWNGDWVKNREFNCGGYYVGGNHYDTRLENLP